MLTVLNVGYPFAAAGPDAVGGAEQVLSQIDRALARAGARSLVIAPRGSVCAGELIPLDPTPAPFTDRALGVGRDACRRAVAAVLARERVDVIHFHGVDCFDYLPRRGGVPIVVTLHLWPDRYPAALLTADRPDVHFVCVSRAQRLACADLPRCRTIANGVDVETFAGGARRREVLLLGRISPEKGFHLAVDAARAAGLGVVLAGAVFPYQAHRDYFDWVIAPRLGGDVQFVGAADARQKRLLLGRAACVAIPSIVWETSSLTAMEALASGTPVVAFRSPALETLVDDGRTGFLVRDTDGLRDAFAHVAELSPAACRRSAEARCSSAATTAAYLRLYRDLAGARTLAGSDRQPCVRAF